MCTVSYLLTEKGFIITQNRDESPLRDSHQLQSEGTVYYPIDPVSKGTWIAVNDKGVVCSLMNWTMRPALPPRVPELSRGTLIPYIINASSPLNALMTMSLQAYAPFKMIIAKDGGLTSLIWDGVTKTVEELDPTGPHIWSSASLYPKEWQEKRKDWFNAWLEGMGKVNSSEIRWFHNHGGIGHRHYDLVMDRGEVRTTSITQVSVEGSRARLRFKDLSTCLVEEHWMSLQRESTLSPLH